MIGVMGMRIAWLSGLMVGVLFAGDASAQAPPRFSLNLELGQVRIARNDVRIPPEGGTEFSIADLIGPAPTMLTRVEATANLAERHSLRVVWAPVEVNGSGTPAAAIDFAGVRFASIPTEATYQFNSYRATYRYRFFNGDRWQWAVGFTGFIRDARIALMQAGASADDTDVGFVPLAHIRGDGRFTDRWGVMMELDATAAPQGRAFDGAVMLTYQPTPRWVLAGGYRTVEGGADVDTVYNFAWLNAAVGRLSFRF